MRRRTYVRALGAGLAVPALSGQPVTAQSSGTEEWRFEAGDMVISSPTVTDGTVYVGSFDGNLYAVGPPTETATPNVTPTATPTPTAASGDGSDSSGSDSSGDDSSGSDDTASPAAGDDDSEGATSGDGPGFGVWATLAALGGGIAARRRWNEDE